MGNVESYISPQSGLARIYILPTHSKGLYSDLNGQAAISLYPDGSNRGTGLGSTTASGFIAFDIGPGNYDLVASSEGGLSKAQKSLTFAPDTVYFLRPAFYRSANELPKDPSQAVPGFSFDVVPPDAAKSEIQRLNVLALRPETEAFLSRTYAGSTPAQRFQTQPLPQAAPPPVFGVGNQAAGTKTIAGRKSDHSR